MKHAGVCVLFPSCPVSRREKRFGRSQVRVPEAARWRVKCRRVRKAVLLRPDGSAKT